MKGLAAAVTLAMAASVAAAELDPWARRGASEAERAAVSSEEWRSQARAGVWEWGSWRIVVAEDPFNCEAARWCPWALIDKNGFVRARGIALEQPRIEGNAIHWVDPEGALMVAAPE